MHRITGRVVRIDQKTGVKETADAKSGEVTRKPWAFDIITVLVADQAIVEVTRFGDSAVPLPAVGAQVDYAAAVAVRGSRLNVQLDKPWADLFAPTDVRKTA